MRGPPGPSPHLFRAAEGVYGASPSDFMAGPAFAGMAPSAAMAPALLPLGAPPPAAPHPHEQLHRRRAQLRWLQHQQVLLQRWRLRQLQGPGLPYTAVRTAPPGTALASGVRVARWMTSPLGLVSVARASPQDAMVALAPRYSTVSSVDGAFAEGGMPLESGRDAAAYASAAAFSGAGHGSAVASEGAAGLKRLRAAPPQADSPRAQGAAAPSPPPHADGAMAHRRAAALRASQVSSVAQEDRQAAALAYATMQARRLSQRRLLLASARHFASPGMFAYVPPLLPYVDSTHMGFEGPPFHQAFLPPAPTYAHTALGPASPFDGSMAAFLESDCSAPDAPAANFADA